MSVNLEEAGVALQREPVAELAHQAVAAARCFWVISSRGGVVAAPATLPGVISRYPVRSIMKADDRPGGDAALDRERSVGSAS